MQPWCPGKSWEPPLPTDGVPNLTLLPPAPKSGKTQTPGHAIVPPGRLKLSRSAFLCFRMKRVSASTRTCEGTAPRLGRKPNRSVAEKKSKSTPASRWVALHALSLPSSRISKTRLPPAAASSDRKKTLLLKERRVTPGPTDHRTHLHVWSRSKLDPP